jgi:hypothetical protein
MMMLAAVSPVFSDWENFYVIVGSSAGALTGLQFVVMALIAEGRVAGSTHEISAFGTPTIVHFCVALLIAAVACCPWRTLGGPAAVLAACGVAGMLYILNAARHARQGTNYKPDIEDWIWYLWSPLAAYLFLFAAATLLTRHPTFASFSVAAISLALLFLGIRNAWDTVTFIALQQREASDSTEQGHSGAKNT